MSKKVKFAFFSFLTLIIVATGTYLSAHSATEAPFAPKTAPGEDHPTEIRIPSHGFEQPVEEELDRFFSRRNLWGRFNGTVLIASAERIFTRAYGYSDFRTKEKLSVETAFQLASVSKPITSTAILLLEERGLLSVKDSVGKYIPGFKNPTVTIEELLTHCSGLSDYTRVAASPMSGQGENAEDKFLTYLCQNSPDWFYSGRKRHAYSNTNYAVLALIVEKASGEDFASFLQKNIFNPLGMSRTFCYDRETFPLRSGIAQGHNEYRNAYPPDMTDEILGDKGVYSTVEDMFRFDYALRKNLLLSPLSQEKAYTNHTGWLSPYGYGWRIKETGGTRAIYHTGWWHGFKTCFVRLPEKDKVAVVLENHLRTCVSTNDLIDLLESIP